MNMFKTTPKKHKINLTYDLPDLPYEYEWLGFPFWDSYGYDWLNTGLLPVCMFIFYFYIFFLLFFQSQICAIFFF